ncbi:MAG: hypothetical protein O2999_11875 [Nitrospirae bacterium]|nr:hypothetical protein [Nitrospirota bacterium]MDA1304975.1 hypothetical protein [Nitrospirota bacterium]
MEKGIRFSIKNDVDNLRYKFDFLEKEQKNLQKEFHAYLVSRSMGQNPDDLPLNRYIPIQVYLSEDGENKIYRMSKAIKNFSEEFGLSISDEFPSQTGSWLKKWFGKTKDAITQIELQEIFQKMEHVLEVHTLGIDQAKIDKAQAEAAGVLLKELRETQNAACQIGSLLLVKVTDNEGNSNVFCRTLNSNEMIFLGKNQHVLKKPNEIFESLKNANDELLGLPDRKA